MSQDTSFMKPIVILWICAARFDSVTGFLMCNFDNPVPYEQDQVCCDGTLHNTLDSQGRKRDCCSSQLFYPDKCRCEESSKLTSLNSGYDPGLCLVTVSEPSRTDTTKVTPSSSKVTEIANIAQNKRCLNPSHKYCKNSGNCFNPSDELCCPDGIFKGILLCPPQDSNSKFCTDSVRFGKTVCSEKYTYAYEISVGEMIPQEDSSKTFVARARPIISKGHRIRKRRSSKKFLQLKINVTNPYKCAITGRIFTVFSTEKKRRWNSASYIYLDKEDLVFSGKIRHKRLNNIYKTCSKSIPNHSFEAKNVWNSGYRQYCTVLISVALLFALECIAF